MFCVHVGPKRLSGPVLSLSAHFKVPASKEQFSVGMGFYSWSDARHQPVGSECVAELSESRGKQKEKFGVSCPNGNKCTLNIKEIPVLPHSFWWNYPAVTADSQTKTSRMYCEQGRNRKHKIQKVWHPQILTQ